MTKKKKIAASQRSQPKKSAVPKRCGKVRKSTKKFKQPHFVDECPERESFPKLDAVRETIDDAVRNYSLASTLGQPRVLLHDLALRRSILSARKIVLPNKNTCCKQALVRIPKLDLKVDCDEPIQFAEKTAAGKLKERRRGILKDEKNMGSERTVERDEEDEMGVNNTASKPADDVRAAINIESSRHVSEKTRSHVNFKSVDWNLPKYKTPKIQLKLTFDSSSMLTMIPGREEKKTRVKKILQKSIIENTSTAVVNKQPSCKVCVRKGQSEAQTIEQLEGNKVNRREKKGNGNARKKASKKNIVEVNSVEKTSAPLATVDGLTKNPNFAYRGYFLREGNARSQRRGQTENSAESEIHERETMNKGCKKRIRKKRAKKKSVAESRTVEKTPTAGVDNMETLSHGFTNDRDYSNRENSPYGGNESPRRVKSEQLNKNEVHDAKRINKKCKKVVISTRIPQNRRKRVNKKSGTDEKSMATNVNKLETLPLILAVASPTDRSGKEVHGMRKIHKTCKKVVISTGIHRDGKKRANKKNLDETSFAKETITVDTNESETSSPLDTVSSFLNDPEHLNREYSLCGGNANQESGKSEQLDQKNVRKMEKYKQRRKKGVFIRRRKKGNKKSLAKKPITVDANKLETSSALDSMSSSSNDPEHLNPKHTLGKGSVNQQKGKSEQLDQKNVHEMETYKQRRKKGVSIGRRKKGNKNSLAEKLITVDANNLKTSSPLDSMSSSSNDPEHLNPKHTLGEENVNQQKVKEEQFDQKDVRKIEKDNKNKKRKKIVIPLGIFRKRSKNTNEKAVVDGNIAEKTITTCVDKLKTLFPLAIAGDFSDNLDRFNREHPLRGGSLGLQKGNIERCQELEGREIHGLENINKKRLKVVVSRKMHGNRKKRANEEIVVDSSAAEKSIADVEKLEILSTLASVDAFANDHDYVQRQGNASLQKGNSEQSDQTVQDGLRKINGKRNEGIPRDEEKSPNKKDIVGMKRTITANIGRLIASSSLAEMDVSSGDCDNLDSELAWHEQNQIESTQEKKEKRTSNGNQNDVVGPSARPESKLGENLTEESALRFQEDSIAQKYWTESEMYVTEYLEFEDFHGEKEASDKDLETLEKAEDISGENLTEESAFDAVRYQHDLDQDKSTANLPFLSESNSALLSPKRDDNFAENNTSSETGAQKEADAPELTFHDVFFSRIQNTRVTSKKDFETFKKAEDKSRENLTEESAFNAVRYQYDLDQDKSTANLPFLFESNSALLSPKRDDNFAENNTSSETGAQKEADAPELTFHDVFFSHIQNTRVTSKKDFETFKKAEDKLRENLTEESAFDAVRYQYDLDQDKSTANLPFLFESNSALLSPKQDDNFAENNTSSETPELTFQDIFSSQIQNNPGTIRLPRTDVLSAAVPLDQDSNDFSSVEVGAIEGKFCHPVMERDITDAVPVSNTSSRRVNILEMIIKDLGLESAHSSKPAFAYDVQPARLILDSNSSSVTVEDFENIIDYQHTQFIPESSEGDLAHLPGYNSVPMNNIAVLEIADDKSIDDNDGEFDWSKVDERNSVMSSQRVVSEVEDIEEPKVERLMILRKERARMQRLLEETSDPELANKTKNAKARRRILTITNVQILPKDTVKIRSDVITQSLTKELALHKAGCSDYKNALEEKNVEVEDEEAEHHRKAKRRKLRNVPGVAIDAALKSNVNLSMPLIEAKTDVETTSASKSFMKSASPARQADSTENDRKMLENKVTAIDEAEETNLVEEQFCSATIDEAFIEAEDSFPCAVERRKRSSSRSIEDCVANDMFLLSNVSQSTSREHRSRASFGCAEKEVEYLDNTDSLQRTDTENNNATSSAFASNGNSPTGRYHSDASSLTEEAQEIERTDNRETGANADENLALHDSTKNTVQAEVDADNRASLKSRKRKWLRKEESENREPKKKVKLIRRKLNNNGFEVTHSSQELQAEQKCNASDVISVRSDSCDDTIKSTNSASNGSSRQDRDYEDHRPASPNFIASILRENDLPNSSNSEQDENGNSSTSGSAKPCGSRSKDSMVNSVEEKRENIEETNGESSSSSATSGECNETENSTTDEVGSIGAMQTNSAAAFMKKVNDMKELDYENDDCISLYAESINMSEIHNNVIQFQSPFRGSFTNETSDRYSTIDNNFQSYRQKNQMECDKDLQMCLENNNDTELIFPNETLEATSPMAKRLSDSKIVIPEKSMESSTSIKLLSETESCDDDDLAAPKIRPLPLSSETPVENSALISNSVALMRPPSKYAINSVKIGVCAKPAASTLSTFDLEKIFKGNCFAKMRSGLCYRKPCRFRHDLTPRLTELMNESEEVISGVMDYAITQGYRYFCQYIYFELLTNMSCTNIMELYHKLYSASFMNPEIMSRTVNALSESSLSLAAIVRNLATLLTENDNVTPLYILQVVRPMIPRGCYWETLRDLFLRIEPSVSCIETILHECTVSGKSKDHIEDVYSNFIEKLSLQQMLQVDDTLKKRFNDMLDKRNLLAERLSVFTRKDLSSPTDVYSDPLPCIDTSETCSVQSIVRNITSPDTTQLIDVDSNNSWESGYPFCRPNLQEPSVTQSLISSRANSSSSTSHADRSSSQERAASASDGSIVRRHDDVKSSATNTNFSAPYNLQKIEGLPEPMSAHRDRFWKVNLDIESVREGLKHQDYQHVLEVLNKYADAEQNLFTSNCYKMLRREILQSEYDITRIIQLSAHPGAQLGRTLFQLGFCLLTDLADAGSWVVAYRLLKSLLLLRTQNSAAFTLLSAEICLANDRPLKALTILKQSGLLYSRQSRWRVAGERRDESWRVMVMKVLLDVLCKKSPEHAFAVLELLVRDQSCAYYPIDLTSYVDKVALALLIAERNNLLVDLGWLIISRNLTLQTTVYRSVVASILHSDVVLARQLLRYGCWLGVYPMFDFATPIHVRIDTHWTKEEMYLIMAEFLDNLSMNVGHASEQLRPNQLTIYLIFDVVPIEQQLFSNECGNQNNAYQVKASKLLMKSILESKFSPPIVTVAKERGRLVKLQSRSVVDYLKSSRVTG